MQPTHAKKLREVGAFLFRKHLEKAAQPAQDVKPFEGEDQQAFADRQSRYKQNLRRYQIQQKHTQDSRTRAKSLQGVGQYMPWRSYPAMAHQAKEDTADYMEERAELAAPRVAREALTGAAADPQSQAAIKRMGQTAAGGALETAKQNWMPLLFGALAMGGAFGGGQRLFGGGGQQQQQAPQQGYYASRRRGYY